jgi:hypothetical protein
LHPAPDDWIDRPRKLGESPADLSVKPPLPYFTADLLRGFLGSCSAGVTVCHLSGCGAVGCEGRGEPRAGGEELLQRVEFVQAPLADSRQVGLDDSEVDQSLEGAPAAAGGPLLHFDGALVAVG